MKIHMGIPEWGLPGLVSAFYSGITRPAEEKQKLEQAFQHLLGIHSLVLTDLGRQCIYIALTAIGLKSSDEVIVPSYACQNVLIPVLAAGCKPVFADCGPDLNISFDHVTSLVNKNTKVIIVPHLYGKIAPIETFSAFAVKNNLFLIDDAAQVFGAKINNQYVGTFGTFGVFSFGPFKSIMATKGGALIDCRKNMPNPSALSPFVKSRDWKQSLIIALKSWLKFSLRRYTYALLHPDINEKNQIGSPDTEPDMTEMLPREMAAHDISLILKQIQKMKNILKKRRFLSEKLASLIKNNDLFFSLPNHSDDHVFVKYVICLNDKYQGKRTSFLSYLKQNGIEAHAGYYPLHLQKPYSRYLCKRESLPFTERIWPKIVCLPIHSSMDIQHIEYMAEVITNHNW